MPLPVTLSYEHCLRKLRVVSINTAHLVERLAEAVDVGGLTGAAPE